MLEKSYELQNFIVSTFDDKEYQRELEYGNSLVSKPYHDPDGDRDRDGDDSDRDKDAADDRDNAVDGVPGRE